VLHLKQDMLRGTAKKFAAHHLFSLGRESSQPSGEGGLQPPISDSASFLHPSPLVHQYIGSAKANCVGKGSPMTARVMPLARAATSSFALPPYTWKMAKPRNSARSAAQSRRLYLCTCRLGERAAFLIERIYRNYSLYSVCSLSSGAFP